MDKETRYLIFDESGNLGTEGRYFVIACIDTQNYKGLHNIMKRKILQAKTLFPEFGNMHANEIKAKDAYPMVKYHMLETIAKKDVKIHYIVADLKNIEERILKDNNIAYNYLTKMLLDKVIAEPKEEKTIHIIMDKKTTKVASTNSMFDYIKTHFLAEKRYKINFICEYRDSDASNAYVVQAADYVANAIYGKFERENAFYYERIKKKVNVIQHFPYDKFGD